MNEVAYRKIICRVTGKEPATYTRATQVPVNIDENMSVDCDYQPTVPEVPAPYFLAEILALHRLSLDERREIHKAKLAYGEIRLLQDA